MSVKVKDLRNLVQSLKTTPMQAAHALEQYEAQIQNTPPLLRNILVQELAAMRQHNAIARASVLRKVGIVESMLADDEERNWWKGEDRDIEVNYDFS